MDPATNYRDASFPWFSFNSGGRESELNNSSISSKTSSRGDTLIDSESAEEFLARYELDTVCFYEKLTSLNMLSLHVEIMESDFEAFLSDMDPEMAIKALEYNLLTGFLDSEVRVLETHISDFQREEENVREFLSSRKKLVEIMRMADLLYVFEKFLEQSLQYVLEIKTRSAKFEKNLLRFAGDEESSNNSDNLETLTMRVRVLEQKVVNAKEEAETALEKFYVAESTIKDLREQIIEAESRVENSSKDTYEEVVKLETELSDAKVKLQHAEAINEARQEEKNMLNSTIKDMGAVIEDMRSKLTQAGIETESAEDRCIFLSELNEDLRKELGWLKAYLHQMEVTKKESAKEISFYSKLLMDMAMQMALEREGLQKQISSLVKLLMKKDASPAVKVSHGDKANNFTTESKQPLSTNFECDPDSDDSGSRIDAYRHLYADKNGNFVQDAPGRHYVEMVALWDAHRGAEDPLSDSDIMRQVLGDRCGWERGIGPKIGRSSSSQPPSQTQRNQRFFSQEEVEEMITTQLALSQQQQHEQQQWQTQMMQQLKREMRAYMKGMMGTSQQGEEEDEDEEEDQD